MAKPRAKTQPPAAPKEPKVPEIGPLSEWDKYRIILHHFKIREEEFCLFLIDYILNGQHWNYKCVPDQMIPMHVGQIHQQILGK